MTNDDIFSFLLHIKQVLSITQGNDYFRSVAAQRKSVTPAQVQACVKILRNTPPFQKLLKLARTFSTFKDASEYYAEKQQAFLESGGRAVKPKDMLYYALVGAVEERFAFLKELTQKQTATSTKVSKADLKKALPKIRGKLKKIGIALKAQIGANVNSTYGMAFT